MCISSVIRLHFLLLTGQTEWSVNSAKVLKVKELSFSNLLCLIVQGQNLAGHEFGSEIGYVG